MENQKNNQLQLNLHPDVALGQYCNLALITHSKNEFIFDFAATLPGMAKPDVASRIIMVPEHAKRLLLALQENVLKYERKFGPIDLGEGINDRTINPFGPKVES